MHTAIRAVTQHDVNLRVLARCEPSDIAVERSKFIGELAYSVGLILYCNPCHAVELYQSCGLALNLYGEQPLTSTPGSP